MQRVCGALRGAAKSSVCTRGTDGAGMRCCALLVPATQHGAGCGVQVCEGVGSRGSLEPGAMEQRALRMPSPLLRISVGNVWWWGVAMAVGSAPERGDGGERVPRQLRKLPSVGLFCTFLLDPEADPEAGPPTPRALYSVQRSEALRGIAIRWGERCASPGEC